ncbi:mitochondrial sodium hydrogen exchanger nha2-like protein [Lasius niger]|uniref:Mitochondrial sodium hydrogen exchanger nha2-like protein n=1 Tax=Lasius niger TaxID=67767 RepID=A0A0J7K2W6_LASNI|nr:mitochondrial sodium hydrogen exchanger nha2-like protein [Lasius niger]
MSPGVTVNCMLTLAEQGYGEDKGLTSLLCTAASIDDVHIVSLFSICFSFVFSNGITEIKHAMWYRIGGLALASLMCTTAASRLAVTGGGYLATIILSFIAIHGWRILTVSYDVRSTTAFLTTLRMPFTWKERFFVAIAWIPKGTLQAALAPIAFERARKEGDSTKIELALDVVRLSVITIVFLAPLGAIGMMTSGPFFLNKISIEEQQRERELSYSRIVGLQPVRTRKQRNKPANNIIKTPPRIESTL